MEQRLGIAEQRIASADAVSSSTTASTSTSTSSSTSSLSPSQNRPAAAVGNICESPREAGVCNGAGAAGSYNVGTNSSSSSSTGGGSNRASSTGISGNSANPTKIVTHPPPPIKRRSGSGTGSGGGSSAAGTTSSTLPASAAAAAKGCAKITDFWKSPTLAIDRKDSDEENSPLLAVSKSPHFDGSNSLTTGGATSVTTSAATGTTSTAAATTTTTRPLTPTTRTIITTSTAVDGTSSPVTDERPVLSPTAPTARAAAAATTTTTSSSPTSTAAAAAKTTITTTGLQAASAVATEIVPTGAARVAVVSDRSAGVTASRAPVAAAAVTKTPTTAATTIATSITGRAAVQQGHEHNRGVVSNNGAASNNRGTSNNNKNNNNGVASLQRRSATVTNGRTEVIGSEVSCELSAENYRRASGGHTTTSPPSTTGRSPRASDVSSAPPTDRTGAQSPEAALPLSPQSSPPSPPPLSSAASSPSSLSASSSSPPPPLPPQQTSDSGNRVATGASIQTGLSSRSPHTSAATTATTTATGVRVVNGLLSKGASTASATTTTATAATTTTTTTIAAAATASTSPPAPVGPFATTKQQRKSAANNFAVRLNQAKREAKKAILLSGDTSGGGSGSCTGTKKVSAAAAASATAAAAEPTTTVVVVVDRSSEIRDAVKVAARPDNCSKKMRMNDANQIEDSDDDVIIIDPPPPASARSPRKLPRATPAISYKEVDPSQFEERKPKVVTSRSLEKFKEFFKAAAERSKAASAELSAKAGNVSSKAPRGRPRKDKEKQSKLTAADRLWPERPLAPMPKPIHSSTVASPSMNGTTPLATIVATPPIIMPAALTDAGFGFSGGGDSMSCSPASAASMNSYLMAINRVVNASTPLSPDLQALSVKIGDGHTPKRRGRKPVIRTEEEREARKQAYRKKLAEKLKEKRRLEREAKEQAKALHDDLSIRNLRPLPILPEFDCMIPNESLGDVLCILEFMSAYSSALGVKEYFSQGVTFDILERAFTENDPMGLLVNIVRILLGCIFRLQKKDWTIDYTIRPDSEESDKALILAQENAAAAGREFQETFGCMLHSAPLDSFTYSEMVRWHLKASGAPGIDLRDRVHCHQGFTPKEDPGFRFVRENPDIMKKLECGSLARLDLIEKIKIIRCLVDQLLTFELFRETIEEGLDRCVELKVQLKKLLWRKKLLEDEERGVKREKLANNGNNSEEMGGQNSVTDDGRSKTNDDEKKRKNWRYDLPEMPRHELEQKIASTETQINKVWYRFGLSCLGEDRAHRIYNVMHSVPAIVVESLACVEAPCIEGGTPTSNDPRSSADATANSTEGSTDPDDVVVFRMEEFIDSELKEATADNEIKLHNSDSTDRNISRTEVEVAGAQPIPDKVQKLIGKKEAVDGLPENNKVYCPVDHSLVCSGRVETCQTHAEKKPRYYFIQSQEQLDALIDALAPKGLRETVLKETITNEIDYLRNVIKRTPLSKLSRTLRDTYRRKYPSESLQPSTVVGIETNLALNLVFRELLLELEDRAAEASLGGFKGDSRRPSWRRELEAPLNKMQRLSPEEANRLMTVSESEVQKMVERLLEFLETIPPRFLTSPLGGQNPDQNKMDNWKTALANCTNFSQLFLFYSTLEASIQWQKGLVQARCKVCRGKPTPDRMVRCERCDHIFHLSCLKPALREVPLETWFCKSCEPESVPESPPPKKPRVNGNTPAVENETINVIANPPEIIENNEFCEVCGKDEKLLLCDACPRSFHLGCLELKRAPRGDWRCPACSLEPKKYRQELKELRKRVQEKDTLETDAPVDLNQCAKCGELLSRGHIDCKGCTRKFHLICADLPKRPKGDWYCRKKCEPGYVANDSLNQASFLGETFDDDDDNDDDDDDANDEEQREEQEQGSVLDEEAQPMEEEENVAEDAERSFAEADAYDYKACSDILDVLKKSDHAWPFLTPVTKKDAPDYHKIIKKPMDFGTIQTKLNDCKYTRNSEFVSDVMQVFINCEQYNMEEAEVYGEGKQLLELFVDLLDNYSMAALLDTRQFKWLDDYINNRCPKCEQEFADGAKTVSCKGCSSTFHPKCAGVKGTPAKWTCSNCTQMVENEEVEDSADEEDEQMNGDKQEPVDVHGFDYKACTDLLDYLVKHDLSFPFRKPVTKKDAPDYFDIISQPMDLSTIQNSLNNMGYKTNRDLVADIVLMFDNCERYNHEASDIYADARTLWQKAFKRMSRTGFDALLDRVPDWKTVTKPRRSTKTN